MSLDNTVDYIPNQAFANIAIDPSDGQHKNFQKRKWQVLMGTFLIILITDNAIIWSQSLTYQSQSMLHFSYASQTELEFSKLAQRQIALHQQRLKNYSVLSLVVVELEQSQGLMTSVQALLSKLSAQASITERIITLKANGSEPQTLKPILDAWIKVYLELVASET
jgi:succinoglycan biosynthesis transport protein ExoP